MLISYIPHHDSILIFKICPANDQLSIVEFLEKQIPFWKKD